MKGWFVGKGDWKCECPEWSMLREIRIPKWSIHIHSFPSGDCSSSYHSFQFLPISTPIYGDVKLYNGSNGLEEVSII